jgi:acetyl-CoA acyltransferase
MKPIRRIFVVGGAHTTFLGKGHPEFIWKKHPDFGKRKNPSLEEHMHGAVLSALEKTGVNPQAIERGFVGNFAGQTFNSQGHLGAMAARIHPDLAGKPWSRVEAACASGGIAITGAVESLQAGYDVALVVGAEMQTSVSARIGADFLARAAHYAEEREIDEFTFPAMFARRWKAYQEAFGATDADLAHVVTKAYSNGNRNPFAHMRAAKRDYEWAAQAGERNPCFLANEELKPFMKMSDCSQVSDGGSAAILATEDGLTKLGIQPNDCVELKGWGLVANPLGQVNDYTQLATTRAAATEAFNDAGIDRDTVGVVEVHDCFAVTEWLMVEALGFAQPGKASELTLSGATHIDGALPVNTGGGLLSFGHPVGATGVKQVVEVWRQMKGLCGDYQIPTPPQVGVTANMGGDDRTAVVTVLQNIA